MEKELTIIITMAGMGTRFREVGYACPKYMISAKNKTLFEWSLESLLGYSTHVLKYVFVVRKEEESESFIKGQCAKYGINNVEVVELGHMTDGQATSCMYALPYCDQNSAILIYNIDTYVEAYEMKYEDISGDGHIPCFHGEGSHWSFVRTDEEGKVAEVREKKRISDNCTLGAYYFSSARLYKDLYEEYYADDSQIEKGEKYIAPLYNLMVKKGMKVTMSLVQAEKVHVLGTPEELKVFVESDI